MNQDINNRSSEFFGLVGNRVKRQKASAFTLIELLVAISIISILASLLLPALGRAKAKARGMECLSNLKQLQLSWHLYLTDNEDRLPPNNSTASGASLRSASESWVVGNALEDLTSSNIEQGVLFPQSKSAAIYRCPADTSTIIGQKNLRRTRSYSLDWYLGVTANVHLDPRIKLRLAQIVSPGPSEVYAFIDEDERSINDGAFFSPQALGGWGDVPAIRHGMKCIISFADGHAGSKQWQLPLMLGKAADTQDVRWLWEHSP